MYLTSTPLRKTTSGSRVLTIVAQLWAWFSCCSHCWDLCSLPHLPWGDRLLLFQSTAVSQPLLWLGCPFWRPHWKRYPLLRCLLLLVITPIPWHCDTYVFYMMLSLIRLCQPRFSQLSSAPSPLLSPGSPAIPTLSLSITPVCGFLSTIPILWIVLF